MKEVFKKNVEIESSEGELDKSLLRKRGNYKTFGGWLISSKNHAQKKENPTTAIFLGEIYKKYMEFEKVKKKPLIEIEIIEGWKGIDQMLK